MLKLLARFAVALSQFPYFREEHFSGPHFIKSYLFHLVQFRYREMNVFQQFNDHLHDEHLCERSRQKTNGTCVMFKCQKRS